jgi:hypothetical protein
MLKELEAALDGVDFHGCNGLSLGAEQQSPGFDHLKTYTHWPDPLLPRVFVDPRV